MSLTGKEFRYFYACVKMLLSHGLAYIVLPERGGGYSHFFFIPAYTAYPKKKYIWIIKHPKKLFEILATPQKIIILYIDL